MTRFMELTEIKRFDICEGITETSPVYINLDSICYVQPIQKVYYPSNGKRIVLDNISAVWFNNHHLEVTESYGEIASKINSRVR